MFKDLTLAKAHSMLVKKEITSVELMHASQEIIESTDANIQAFVTKNYEEALEQAKEVDVRIQKGENISRLAGIPCGIKDMFCTKGLKTTASAKMLKNFTPPYDASVIASLRNKGGVFMGKLNLDAWAHGTSTENSDFFNTHNPWDLKRTPGGSSGGSAASVAASQVLWATATDTGGSIRQPAAMCGVTGWKPTYGMVSRAGVIAMASSLDTIGAIAKSVEDISIIATEMAGRDEADATSIDTHGVDYFAQLQGDIRGMKVGVPKEYFIEGMHPEVEKSVREAITVLQSRGAQIVDISLPLTRYGIAVYYIICPSEVSANLARYDGIRYGHAASNAHDTIEMFAQARDEGFGAEAKRRIMMGTYALSSGYYDAYYRKAQKVRTLVIREFEEAFRQVDVIATPTTPHTAFSLGEKCNDPLSLYLEDVFTVTANIAGICGISLPCGFDSKNLPIGLQLLGPQRGEQKIFNVGHAYQQETDWHEKRPSVF